MFAMTKKVRACAVALVLLACAVVAALLTPATARAIIYDRIDVDREGSLAVRLLDGTEPLPGARFSLWRVADVASDASFTLTGEFAGYRVDLSQLESSEWRAAAQTLAAYAARDGLVPDAMVETDADGRADFGPQKTGLYLLVADEFEYNGRVWQVESALVSVPDLDDSGAWNYDVAADAKSTSHLAPIDELVVQKVWADDDDAAGARPQSVTVQLLGDGKVTAEVTLSAANGWRHTFENLDGEVSWTVVEKEVPAPYAVSVSREGTTFTVTNTAPDTPLPGTGEKLPQTGLLWWPVVALAAGGLSLMIFGLYRRRSS